MYIVYRKKKILTSLWKAEERKYILINEHEQQCEQQQKHPS